MTTDERGYDLMVSTRLDNKLGCFRTDLLCLIKREEGRCVSLAQRVFISETLVVNGTLLWCDSWQDGIFCGRRNVERVMQQSRIFHIVIERYARVLVLSERHFSETITSAF